MYWLLPEDHPFWDVFFAAIAKKAQLRITAQLVCKRWRRRCLLDLPDFPKEFFLPRLPWIPIREPYLFERVPTHPCYWLNTFDMTKQPWLIVRREADFCCPTVDLIVKFDKAGPFLWKQGQLLNHWAFYYRTISVTPLEFHKTFEIQQVLINLLPDHSKEGRFQHMVEESTKYMETFDNTF